MKRNVKPGTKIKGERIKPPSLRVGDTIGIIAPASSIDAEALKRGCARLLTLGYKPLFFDSIFDSDLYFAGSVRQRVNDLHEMFRRDDIRAVLCARGGYGCNYLLPYLDLELIRSHPKPFIGYSDVTTLLTWFVDNGLGAFHGPMATKDFAHTDGVDLVSWRSVLSGDSYTAEFNGDIQVKPLVPGRAQGTLYGGCLSMLTASLGTPYEIRTRGTIVFIEDIAAKPYQVDRMLMQLKTAGKFAGVRGIIFGEMLECEQPGASDYDVSQIVMRIVRDLGIPVAYGLPSGHVTRANITLPLGVRASLVVTDSSVRLACKPATIAADSSQSAHS
ncbi:MAG TPA: LD-carboxypeptidase [Clostridia bacterium]|nr:LD-carboxypeptidase [Clostridia bacterium]